MRSCFKEPCHLPNYAQGLTLFTSTMMLWSRRVCKTSWQHINSSHFALQTSHWVWLFLANFRNWKVNGLHDMGIQLPRALIDSIPQNIAHHTMDETLLFWDAIATSNSLNGFGGYSWMITDPLIPMFYRLRMSVSEVQPCTILSTKNDFWSRTPTST